MPTTTMNMPIVRPGFASRTALVLGCIAVILGILEVLCEILKFVLGAVLFSDALSAIIAAVMTIIAGGFGIASAKKKTNCKIVTTLTLSVLAAVFIISVLLSNIICLASPPPWNSPHRIPVCSFQVILSVLSSVTCIWLSATCCKATCCVPGLEEGGTLPYSVQYRPTPDHRNEETG